MADFGSAIIGTGSYLPEKVLTNFDFEKILDTNDDWITARTGIKSRHIIGDDETTVDMAVNAAKKAIESAGIEASEIELIINATFTPDMPLPSGACLIQERLGLGGCPAFDLAAACSGFVYALSVGSQFIKTGAYKKILVIGSEAITRFTDYTDRGTCILFGDGAGAVVLSQVEDTSRGVVYSKLAADGAGAELLQIPAGGTRKPTSAQTVADREHYIRMQGREIYKFAVNKMQTLISEAMEECGLTVDDVAMVVPHQVNKRIIDSACNHSGFPPEKVFVNIHETGNTSAASVPIALDAAVRSGRVKKGDTIIMVAFGAGLTWGSAVVKM